MNIHISDFWLGVLAAVGGVIGLAILVWIIAVIIFFTNFR